MAAPPPQPTRKLNFRPRPIDIYKKLEIIRSKKGIQLDDEVDRGVPSDRTAVESDEEAVRPDRPSDDFNRCHDWV